MVSAALLATIAVGCLFAAARLRRASWPLRGPHVAVVAWQALGLAWGISTIGALLAFGLAPYEQGVFGGLSALAVDAATHGLYLSGLAETPFGATQVVAIVAAVALTLSACGREAADSSSGETGKAVSTGAATGTITVWAMGAEGEKLPELVEDFSAEYPDITVNVTAVPWDSAHDKFVNSITAGTTPDVAMVGTTGAGKSTALALLHRAFDPQSGVVKIDGMDIKAIKLASLRHNIGVVYQEALLFNRSIAENLRVGNPDATDAQLLEAAARAAGVQHLASADGRHAAAEPVAPLADQVARLEGALHRSCL